MPIETLDDVVEWLANQAGIYGAHDDDAEDDPCERTPCRICWTEEVLNRINAAVTVGEQLRRGAMAVERVSPFETDNQVQERIAKRIARG